MKIHLECIPCFISQSIESARMTRDDKSIHEKVVTEVMKYFQTSSFKKSPPEISRDVHEIIRKITKSKDPYKEVKDLSNDKSKKLYPYLKKIVREADDSLLMAIKLAIIGNVIDFGTSNRFNIEEMIDSIEKKDFNTDAYPRFTDFLKQSKSILYLADNTGEIFFDKLLLEELIKKNIEITYVVKANPIINDATVHDAKFAGIDKLATIIKGDEGQRSSAPGISPLWASNEFLKHFYSSDMVISKGQGNYESLSGCKREIFFFLMIKCPLVAKDIDIEMGKLVLKVNRTN